MAWEKGGIPIGKALPWFIAAITLAAWGVSFRAEISEASRDRFTGADMDRFIERLGREFEDHAPHGEAPIAVPRWRPGRGD